MGAFLGMLLALEDGMTQGSLVSDTLFVASIATMGFALGFALSERPLERILCILFWAV